MKKTLFILYLIAYLSGCAAELSPEGRMVREIQADWANQCEFLGVVTASEGGGYDVLDDRRGAINQIRNQVAEMGGNAFVITDISSSEMRTLVQADAYKCTK